ncbi:TetR/AcrR family transcriptional regulator [Streptomyces kronopolitis]|uniref:TetR/AcrR family transcriptional regulator n=1 Tax=Streptomyces kronopolitis TaxID=1612435 RepID=UPI0020BFDA23|nr:helix-turn-helix domain-containing protein [Streptomyces kronopolitis]MCL6302370.1 TetR/AcrR family transcriptional regulator [Streptomyces kronopolitis]
MPAARESLLDAAYTALADRPWAAVRMVEVAAAAGVSRQTLYNEFGSKEGLARALVRRETDNCLAGVARALSRRAPAGGIRGEAAGGGRGDAAGRVVAAAAWTLRSARANPLVRAVLTGCWGDRLPPAPTAPAGPVPGGAPRHGVPAPRAATPGEGPLPGPAEFVGRFCDQAVAALRPGWPEEELPALGSACETAARLTLSWVLAPPAAGAAAAPEWVPRRRPSREPDTEAVSHLVRSAFLRMTAGGRPADGG